MYSLLPFSPCASSTKANRTPQNRAGGFADCREFFILVRDVIARVDFGFCFFDACRREGVCWGFILWCSFFRLPVGGSLGLGFLFLWLSFWFLFCLFVGNLNIM